MRVTDDGADWSRRLIKEIGVLLVAKLAALILIWSLFFSPTHQVEPDDADLGRAFSLEEDQ